MMDGSGCFQGLHFDAGNLFPSSQFIGPNFKHTTVFPDLTLTACKSVPNMCGCHQCGPTAQPAPQPKTAPQPQPQPQPYVPPQGQGCAQNAQSQSQAQQGAQQEAQQEIQSQPVSQPCEQCRNPGCVNAGPVSLNFSNDQSKSCSTSNCKDITVYVNCKEAETKSEADTSKT
ncbi:hypothetical protein J3B02_003346 [Coemansia erecta]|nr:hypothetical protein J3B02_003346 [Coemansia erecta]